MEITVPDGFLMKEELIEQLTRQMLDLISPKADKSALEVALADISQLEGSLDGFVKITGETVEVPEITVPALSYSPVEWPSSVTVENMRTKLYSYSIRNNNSFKSGVSLCAPSGGRYFIIDNFNKTAALVEGGGELSVAMIAIMRTR